jgi:hypothetical protein
VNKRGDGLPPGWADRLQEQRRVEVGSIAAFCSAIARGDRAGCLDAIGQCEALGTLSRAFRAASKQPRPSADMQAFFLAFWKISGDSVRQGIGNDIVLINALRCLLPPYEGPPMMLFRGDSLWNRRRRTYGVSWTAERAVAEAFANGLWRTCEGGSVVVQTEAPASAILARIPDGEDSYGEAEYLVDRRRLADVRVIERLSQKPAR